MQGRILAACWLVLTVAVAGVWAATFDVRDYGARGDGETLDTAAFEKVVELCAQNPGSIMLVSGGKNYLVAPFNMTSDMTLQVDKGATILGVDDASLWTVIKPLPSYCQGRERIGPRYTSLIHGDGLNNIAVTGGGAIDGQGQYWWDAHHAGTLNYTRGRLIEFVSCTNVVIRDVTLKNSPFWTLHPVYCDGVTIENVVIDNPHHSPNTDGIDPDSSANVLIKDCYVSCGDDNIAIKSGMDWCGREFGRPAENITIVGCTFAHGDGIAIGSEMSGGVRNVLVENCTTRFVHEYVQLQSARGRGGVVENIEFRNIIVEADDTAVHVRFDYGGSKPQTNKTATPVLRNLRMIDVEGAAAQAGIFDCLPESPCEDLLMEHVTVVAVEGFRCENAYGKSDHVFPKSCLKEQ